MQINYFKTFVDEGALILNRKIDSDNYTKSFDLDFRSFFGCSPVVCGIIWVHCGGFYAYTKPKHLLWALLFLKSYET